MYLKFYYQICNLCCRGFVIKGRCVVLYVIKIWRSMYLNKNSNYIKIETYTCASA